MADSISSSVLKLKQVFEINGGVAQKCEPVFSASDHIRTNQKESNTTNWSSDYIY
jgi:hypothetical protein